MARREFDIPADLTLAQWSLGAGKTLSAKAQVAYNLLVGGPIEDLDRMTGVLLVAAYLRHQERGSALDVHEMNHLRAAWLAGESGYCSDSHCRTKINPDLSVVVDPKPE